MSRRFAEVVHVGVDAGAGVQPTAFRWRGNHYVVQEVLGHWRERRAWWSGTAGHALHTGAVPLPRATHDLGEEYEVWRVEALRVGALVGVYDLCHDTFARPAIGSWRLLQVAD
jgi:hypothetical protein